MAFLHSAVHILLQKTFTKLHLVEHCLNTIGFTEMYR